LRRCRNCAFYSISFLAAISFLALILVNFHIKNRPSGRSSEEIAVLCDFLRHLHDGLLISRLPTATLHQLCVTSVTLSAYVKGEICIFFDHLLSPPLAMFDSILVVAVFKRGAASDACYQLLSGAVGVYAPLPDHPQEKNVAILRAGDHKTCFGEIGVLEDLPRSATLIAETDVQCVVINKTAFDETLKVLLITYQVMNACKLILFAIRKCTCRISMIRSA
jgi:CRP-like cAMP-binding protein